MNEIKNNNNNLSCEFIINNRTLIQFKSNLYKKKKNFEI